MRLFSYIPYIILRKASHILCSAPTIRNSPSKPSTISFCKSSKLYQLLTTPKIFFLSNWSSSKHVWSRLPHILSVSQYLSFCLMTHVDSYPHCLCSNSSVLTDVHFIMETLIRWVLKHLVGHLHFPIPNHLLTIRTKFLFRMLHLFHPSIPGCYFLSYPLLMSGFVTLEKLLNFWQLAVS